jgi:hypothetical protein
MNLKLIASTLAAVGILALFATQASASEGQAEMENMVGDPSRCVVTSGLFGGNEYNVMVLCRDLVYRENPEALFYTIWIQPLQGGDPIRLGDLGLGNALFKTKTPFSRIFATQERDKNAKTPTGRVALSGNVHGFSFFANNSTSPISPNVPQTPAITPVPTPTPGPSVLSRFRTGGVIMVISIIVIIIMLVVVKPFK